MSAPDKDRIRNIPLTTLKTELLARFKCQKSGNCCKWEGYVVVTDQNIDAMAQQLRLSADEFKSRYIRTESGWHYLATPTHNKNCLLDDCNRCKVYEARPLACRTYPNWPEVWSSHDRIWQETQQCPGLNQALRALLSG